jgi:hypothetical protein
MFLYKQDLNFKLKSILTSKIRYKSRQLKDLNILFIVKNKKKDQVVFLFIVLFLFSGKLPQILKKNLKNKNKFIGFRIFFRPEFLYKFILMYFVILDSIPLLQTKSNLNENRLVFLEFPIIHEIDFICEQYNPFLEYIKSYRFILNTKI